MGYSTSGQPPAPQAVTASQFGQGDATAAGTAAGTANQPAPPQPQPQPQANQGGKPGMAGQGSIGGGKTGGNTPTPGLSNQIAQQGMAPTPVQPTVGQFGNGIGQVAPLGGSSSGGMMAGNPTFGGMLFPAGAGIDSSLAGGAGPAPQTIGPVSPDYVDQLNGLSGAYGQSTQGLNL